MLVKLTGSVEYVGGGFVFLEHEGLSYKIILPEQIALSMQGDVVLYTHEVVRDDTRELFGFFSIPALELFWQLIGISGVGCRSAQKIIFAASIDQVKGSIMKGDLAFLTSISGIGKKTAQKIILELKGVLAEEPDVLSHDQESVEALMSLGYSRKQAQDALMGIEATSMEDRIRAALKTLATS